jgi:nucleoside-diphosphate-sugar epimerase
MSAGRLLLAGCGFVGLATARRFHALGWEVVALTRSAESAAQLAGEPFAVQACDILDREALARLGSFDAVIDCVSSGHGTADDYRRVYLEGAEALLAVFPKARFIFTGSTSVYAQNDGSVVDETSPAEPERETGCILRATEERVVAAGGWVLRLAGLYGPGRWALLRHFLEGVAVIEGDGSRWLNHTHRDDAAGAMAFVLADESRRRVPPGIYNVTDSEPMTQRDAYALMAAHTHRPMPPHGPIDLARKRGVTSKRVSNARLRALGWEPLYPSIREGLKAMA